MIDTRDTRDSYYITYILIKLPINDLLLKILLLFIHLFNKDTNNSRNGRTQS